MNQDERRNQWIKGLSESAHFVGLADKLTGAGKHILDWDSKMWTDRLLLICYFEHETKGIVVKPSELASKVFTARNSVHRRYQLELEMASRRGHAGTKGEKNIRHRPGEMVEEGFLLSGPPSAPVLTAAGREIALYVIAQLLRSRGVTGEDMRCLSQNSLKPESPIGVTLKRMNLLRQGRDSSELLHTELANALIEFVAGHSFAFPDFYSNASDELRRYASTNLLNLLSRTSGLVRNGEKICFLDESSPAPAWTFRLKLAEDHRESSLKQLLRQPAPPVIVESRPSSGKTCWMLQSASELLCSSGPPLPIFVPLRGLALYDEEITYWNGEGNLKVMDRSPSGNGSEQDLLTALTRAVLCPDRPIQFVGEGLEQIRQGGAVFFLDGWNELSTGLQQLFSETIPKLSQQGYKFVISTIWDDPYLKLIAGNKRYALTGFDRQAALKLLVALGMSQDRAKATVDDAWVSLKHYINPELVQLLSIYPVDKGVPENPVNLFVAWVKQKAVSRALGPSYSRISSLEELDRLLSRHYMRPADNKRLQAQSYLVGPILSPASTDDKQDYALLPFLGRTALSMLTDGSQELSYEHAVAANPLLLSFIEPRPKQDFGNYPVISDPHLLFYFAAYEAVRLYKQDMLPLREIRAFDYLLDDVRMILEYEGLLPHDRPLGTRLVAMKILLSMSSTINPLVWESAGVTEEGLRFIWNYSTPDYFPGMLRVLKSWWGPVKTASPACQQSFLEAVQIILEERPSIVHSSLASFEGEFDSDTSVNHEPDYYVPFVVRAFLATKQAQGGNVCHDTHDFSPLVLWSEGLDDLVPWLVLITPKSLEHDAFHLLGRYRQVDSIASVFTFLLADLESEDRFLWIDALFEQALHLMDERLLGMTTEVLIDEREVDVRTDRFDMALRLFLIVDEEHRLHLLESLCAHLLAPDQLALLNGVVLNLNAPRLSEAWNRLRSILTSIGDGMPSSMADRLSQKMDATEEPSRCSSDSDVTTSVRLEWESTKYHRELTSDELVGDETLLALSRGDLSPDAALVRLKPLRDGPGFERLITAVLGEEGFSSYEDGWPYEHHPDLPQLSGMEREALEPSMLVFMMSQLGECYGRFRQWEYDFGDYITPQGTWIVKCINSAIVDAIDRAYLPKVVEGIRRAGMEILWKRLRWFLSFFWRGRSYPDTRGDGTVVMSSLFIGHNRAIWDVLDESERRWFMLLETLNPETGFELRARSDMRHGGECNETN